MRDLRKGVTWSRKSFLSYVGTAQKFNSKISFEAVKMDDQRPSYECLKFTKVCRNHKSLRGCTEKTTYAQSYFISQILSYIHTCILPSGLLQCTMYRIAGKFWRALNLADWPQPAWTKILTDLNLADNWLARHAHVHTQSTSTYSTSA